MKNGRVDLSDVLIFLGIALVALGLWFWFGWPAVLLLVGLLVTYIGAKLGERA